MRLTADERAELEQLEWLNRYYLDSWLATMQMLDLLRPTVIALRERQGEIIDMIQRGEVSSRDEGEQLLLEALRIWHAEHRETMQVIRSSPN